MRRKLYWAIPLALVTCATAAVAQEQPRTATKLTDAQMGQVVGGDSYCTRTGVCFKKLGKTAHGDLRDTVAALVAALRATHH
jgi:hypothetical protein